MRKNILCLITLLVLLLAASASAARDSQAMSLARGGKTDYCIVIANDAIPAERSAATELQSYLRQVTSADFPIRIEHEVAAGAPQILVGQSRRVKTLAPGVDWAKLGTDGIIIKTIGSNLILAGGRPRGSLYAVYTFLEDTVGCRWWTSTESTIPHRPDLVVEHLDVNYTPKIRFRDNYYLDPNVNPFFCVRMKLSVRENDIPDAYGGNYNILGWVHTFYKWIPPGKYFAAHPEWFSLVNGKRTGENAQLCLTNPELVQEMARVCVEQLKANPKIKMISVSQNDMAGKCECDKCKAVEAEEGSPSGPYIRFVNAVAEEVEKQCPDAMVETLAYFFTRKPPLHAKPRDNVIVRLCPIDRNFAVPIDCDANAPTRDDLVNWAKIAKNLYVWDYVTNFGNYIPPQPNVPTLAPNIRFFERNNVIALFEQGDAECSVGDFVRLRNWLLAHLMWNPSQDENKLIKEFIDGYYGPAGAYVAEYLDLMNHAVDRKKEGIGCIHGDVWIWNLAEITKATTLMDAAEKAVAGDRILTERVRRDRMPLDFLWIMRYDELKQEATKSGVPFAGPKDPYAAAWDFITRLQQWNVRNYVYITPVQGFIDNLKSKFPKPLPTQNTGGH